MGMCGKCTKVSSTLILIAGILLLLKNMGILAWAWVDGWTLAFIVLGIILCGNGSCNDCSGCCGACSVDAKSKKKSKK